MNQNNSVPDPREFDLALDGVDLSPILHAVEAFVPEGSRLLELGAGTGRLTALLAGRSRTICSDINPGLVNFSRLEGRGHLHVVMDAANACFRRAFDVVVSNKFLHTLAASELEKAIEQNEELLNTGGIAIHTFWTGDSPGSVRLNEEETSVGQLVVRFETAGLNKIGSGIYRQLLDGDSMWIAFAAQADRAGRFAH